MPLQGATVLVVEDDPDSRETTGLLLQHLGASVVTVENGDRGLAAVLLHQPDLALVDLVMPEMDGFEFARRIRSDPKYRGSPAECLPDSEDEASVLKTWSVGFDGHLTKPVTEEGSYLSRPGLQFATEPGPAPGADAFGRGGQGSQRAAPHIEGSATRRKTGTPAGLCDKRTEGFR